MLLLVRLPVGVLPLRLVRSSRVVSRSWRFVVVVLGGALLFLSRWFGVLSLFLLVPSSSPLSVGGDLFGVGGSPPFFGDRNISRSQTKHEFWSTFHLVCLANRSVNNRSVNYGLPSNAESIAQPVAHRVVGAIYYFFFKVAPFIYLGRSSSPVMFICCLSIINRSSSSLPSFAWGGASNIWVCRQSLEYLLGLTALGFYMCAMNVECGMWCEYVVCLALPSPSGFWVGVGRCGRGVCPSSVTCPCVTIHFP